MLTESLFADECEPFFNSIPQKQTFGNARHIRFVPILLQN